MEWILTAVSSEFFFSTSVFFFFLFQGSDVHIHDCVIDEGDDCIAVKSGMNQAGIKV